jgi:uncharacterized membrane protein
MDEIMDYLQKEKNMSSVVAERTTKKVTKYDDIRTEFENWIVTKTYSDRSPLTIEGYTAKSIFELAPFLDGLGVFNFLVTLREQPDKAKKYIADGFPRK